MIKNPPITLQKKKITKKHTTTLWQGERGPGSDYFTDLEHSHVVEKVVSTPTKTHQKRKLTTPKKKDPPTPQKKKHPPKPPPHVLGSKKG